ncbi:hypothetical protein [Puerhibacterium puerhi]|uniref:hypothetical protein n=1 Tax=Puerhibacterium puerhi TaxID=2692623 RepID=UPI00135975ED|nr:hypothetical protein [Puerhibacterium puerhi]
MVADGRWNWMPSGLNLTGLGWIHDVADEWAEAHPIATATFDVGAPASVRVQHVSGERSVVVEWDATLGEYQITVGDVDAGTRTTFERSRAAATRAMLDALNAWLPVDMPAGEYAALSQRLYATPA